LRPGGRGRAQGVEPRWWVPGGPGPVLGLPTRLLMGRAVPGFSDPRKQCMKALQMIAEAVSPGPAVFVTHDWWMALFLANSTPASEHHGYNIWPDFLEGYEIDFCARSISYRGEEYSVSMGIACRPAQGGDR